MTLVEDDDAEAEAEAVDQGRPSSSSSAPVAQMVGATKPVSNEKGSVNGGQSSAATELLTGEGSRVPSGGVAETFSNGLNPVREAV